MENEEFKIRVKAHQEDINQLYVLSPDTEMHQAELARFFLSHPGLIGITYPAADVLMNEKDVAIRTEAIIRVAEELKVRSDTTNKKYCVSRRSISENQIKKTIHDIKRERNPESYKKKNSASQKDTRFEVVSFRTTETADDCIEFLSNELCVSRSLLLETLIKAANKFEVSLNE